MKNLIESTYIYTRRESMLFHYWMERGLHIFTCKNSNDKDRFMLEFF